MAQLGVYDLLTRVVGGDCPAAEYVLAAVNRDTGDFLGSESTLLDFKTGIHQSQETSVAELARDILGLSNTQGGVLVVGVADGTRKVTGHCKLDTAALRVALGPYLGTRVEYEFGNVAAVVRGNPLNVPYILVSRNLTAYPALLRKDIVYRGSFGLKLKYLRGSLFFRVDDETRVEPTGGDIDQRAAELGFTGASPRTRSSFLLEEDRPGVRLYAHINDRFVGRQQEVSELVSKFDDARGRGVSIAGLGGIGKTELAIEVVRQLHKAGKFRYVYSGSAKKTLLGAFGPQVTDPFFSDFPTFLRDLGAWLGLDLHGVNSLLELENACTSELAKLKSSLLFADNLETIEDGRLITFLDQRLPANAWLLTTSRFHRVKNYLYSKQLDFLNSRDAAHLLRHELKRQGLEDFASTPIEGLEERCKQLQQHPLTIRWFAWACKKGRNTWADGPGKIPRDDIEAFCVGHTLQTVSRSALKVLAAIAATQGQLELTSHCLERVSGITEPALEGSLYELESAGLISSSVNDESGQVLFSMVPLATLAAREIARKYHWEEEFARGLRQFTASSESTPAPDPLIRDLVDFDPRMLRKMTLEEIGDLKRRVERANQRQHTYRLELNALAAECERHSHNVITADDIYKETAEAVLASGSAAKNERYAKILLEAATVAKMRSQTNQQLQRAVRYLMAIQTTAFASLRVLGTLVELFALLGDKKNYEEFLRRVTTLQRKDPGRFSQAQIDALEEALGRAKEAIARRSVKRISE